MKGPDPGVHSAPCWGEINALMCRNCRENREKPTSLHRLVLFMGLGVEGYARLSKHTHTHEGWRESTT